MCLAQGPQHSDAGEETYGMVCMKHETHMKLLVNKNFRKHLYNVQNKPENVRKQNFGFTCEKTCLRWFVNNKGADQHAQSDQFLCYLLIVKYHIKTCYK